MEVDFDDKRIRNNDVLDSKAKFDLTVSWDNDKKKLYTIILFDLDSSDIHFLTINIPGDSIEKGKNIIEYQSPNLIKDLSPKEYIIQLYEQPSKMELNNMNRKSDLDDFLPDNLILLHELVFKVANKDQEHRFCTCILHVEARNHPECKKGKCYNPYAVCAASVGTTAKNCSKYYKLEDLSSEELKAYSRLYGVKYEEKDNNKIRKSVV